MKGIFLLIAFICIPIAVSAEEIKVTVKGMVCSFCAQGIKKNFSKLPEVESVTPDLEKKLVVINTKSGQTLTDERLKEVITEAGYEVAEIERHP